MILYYSYLKYIAFVIITILSPIAALIILKIIQKLTTGHCRSLVCLNGKTAIVTGGNSGIGFQTALQLASKGCRVIIADRVDTSQAIKNIIQKTNNHSVIGKHLDLTSFQSIRQFAKEINESEERLDILINNAGVGIVGNEHTEDGLHKTMQINHFGPFLLTHLLINLLKKSAPSRIIFVSSGAAFYSNLTMKNLNYPQSQSLNFLQSLLIYANSKLCNVIVANGFAEKLREFGITSNSLHPGIVFTDIYSKSAKVLGMESLIKLFRGTILYIYGKSTEEGAQTTLTLAISNKLQNVSGKHFWDCRPFFMPPKAWNKKFCRDIWEESEKFVHLKDDEKITLKVHTS